MLDAYRQHECGQGGGGGKHKVKKQTPGDCRRRKYVPETVSHVNCQSHPEKAAQKTVLGKPKRQTVRVFAPVGEFFSYRHFIHALNSSNGSSGLKR